MSIHLRRARGIVLALATLFVMNRMYVVSGQERGRGFAPPPSPVRTALDTNSDGKLTPDELAAAKGRMKFDDPAALDTNHDGDISVESNRDGKVGKTLEDISGARPNN